MISEPGITEVKFRNGDVAFKLCFSLEKSDFTDVQKNNLFSIIWITEGQGKAKIDFANHDFSENHLFAFFPRQPYAFSSEKISGIAIYFSEDFFCIDSHETNSHCLFYNPYQLPYTVIDEASIPSLNYLVNQMRKEADSTVVDRNEMIISYLKVFLITIARLNLKQQHVVAAQMPAAKQPSILRALQKRIEKDFKKNRNARDYAHVFRMSTKALSRITMAYFNRTVTELISDRVIIEAKRELYLTDKTIKEIAYELGYEDEYYFSRFFKNKVEVSPRLFRKTSALGTANLQISPPNG